MTVDVLVQWALAIAVSWCVYLVFRLRKHHKDYVLFSLYFVTLNLTSLARFVVFFTQSKNCYFYFYWASQGIVLFMLLGVALGVAFSVLGPFRPLLLWPVGTLILAVSVSGAWLSVVIHSTDLNADPRFILTNTFTAIQQAVVSTSFALMGCALIASWVLSVDCGKRLYGIIAGLAAECFLNAAFLRVIGLMGTPSAHRVTVAARLLASCIWLYFFIDARPELKRLSPREQNEIKNFLRAVVDKSAELKTF